MEEFKTTAHLAVDPNPDRLRLKEEDFEGKRKHGEKKQWFKLKKQKKAC